MSDALFTEASPVADWIYQQSLADPLVDARNLDTRPIATKHEIAQLINTTFWASLLKEEGRAVKPSVFFSDQHSEVARWKLRSELAFTPSHLAKLASGLDPGQGYIGVRRKGSELVIWGICLAPTLCRFWIETLAPGKLVVRDWLRNFAVIKPEQSPQLLDGKSRAVPEAAGEMLLRGFQGSPVVVKHPEVVVEIARVMTRRQNGGCVLLLPAEDIAWRSQISSVYQVQGSRSLEACMDKLGQATLNYSETPTSWLLDPGGYVGVGPEFKERWQSEITRTISLIGRISSIDGAVILDGQLNLVEIGAKMVPVGSHVEMLSTIQVLRPPKSPSFDGDALDSEEVALAAIGGTRHQSAAKFVAAVKGSVAIVSSQDGRLTMMAYSKSDGAVIAMRLEDML